MNNKKLLIVENCSSDLKFENDSDSIILTGLFTTFSTKNRNGRIYESADFLPHVEALKEQINAGALLGELDHPHSFETTLSNVSHVVENLEYDPQQNAIVGRVRLLNTSKGKEAQALIKDGIPLHISSRAAGTVDESGRVRLQQLFTYDLVAEPGFANARLKRINESFGFSNDENFAIYDLSEGVDETPIEGNEPSTPVQPISGEEQIAKNQGVAPKGTDLNMDTTNTKNNMENGPFISYSDFQKYSEHLSEIITDLQSAIANYKTELSNIKLDANGMSDRPNMEFDAAKIDNSAITDLITKEVSSQISKMKSTTCEDDTCVDDLAEKAKAMEEKYSHLEKYITYLAGTLDKSITHQDYITEEVNRMIDHSNYLAENMNKMVGHSDYIVEQLNDTIHYQNYIAEMLDKNIDYSNMLAEEQNKSNAHADYIVEKMNQIVEHNDYLAENINNVISHNDYIVESINSETPKEVINETKVEDKTEPVSEEVTKKEKFDSKSYQTELSEKLNSLISTVKTQYEEAKRAEAEAIEESKKNVEEPKNFTLINYIPARLQERWSKLSNERKEEILAESKMFVINNSQSAEYFWNTRDLREKQIQIKKVEEKVTAQPVAPVNESVINNDYYKNMSEQIKMRMRRFN